MCRRNKNRSVVHLKESCFLTLISSTTVSNSPYNCFGQYNDVSILHGLESASPAEAFNWLCVCVCNHVSLCIKKGENVGFSVQCYRAQQQGMVFGLCVSCFSISLRPAEKNPDALVLNAQTHAVSQRMKKKVLRGKGAWIKEMLWEEDKKGQAVKPPTHPQDPQQIHTSIHRNTHSSTPDKDFISCPATSFKLVCCCW